MKIYVDELPKDCIDCPCESEYYCNLLNEDIGCCEWGEIHKNCPLQSLADYTKQVRKKEREKIKNLNQQLKSQPAEIIEKINGEIYTRMVVECKETKHTAINLILNNILKEYQQ